MFAFLAMVFGMFMAILDIQVVSASLKEIQAGLSAGPDEIAWVQTSYLIAEVVMIPLSGFLGRLLSTRVLFTISAAGFTAASALAATATNMDQMIVYRALQGFIGGGMIPSVFAAAFTIFPPSKRSIVSPMIGLVATLAPTIGPTIGGYLSDAFSWHWLFLINIVPGIGVTIAAWTLIDFDEGDRSLLKRFDWTGLISMGVFLGSMEYVLEEGPQNDWLQDKAVFLFAVSHGDRGTGVLLPRLHGGAADRRPFRLQGRQFHLRLAVLLRHGHRALRADISLPALSRPGARIRFADDRRGRVRQRRGDVPDRPGLRRAVQAARSARHAARRLPRLRRRHLDDDRHQSRVGLRPDLLPQIFRGVSLMLCMVTINNLALGTLPPERLKNASGLFNLTRNLGGAVGLALINTVLIHRSDMHYERLSESINWGNGEALRQLGMMGRNLAARGLDGADRRDRAR